MTRRLADSPTSGPKGGPRTPEGKARCSLNALKHGLNATSPEAMAILASEAGVDLNMILDDVRAHYRPADLIEDELAKRIAKCVWRLALADTMEMRVLQRNAAPSRPCPSYEKIMRYERLVDIHLHRAIAALATKKCIENKFNSQNELSPRSRRA